MPKRRRVVDESDDESDDEDLPLSKLVNKKQNGSVKRKATAIDDSDDDSDEMSLAQLQVRKKSKPKPKAKARARAKAQPKSKTAAKVRGCVVGGTGGAGATLTESQTRGAIAARNGADEALAHATVGPCRVLFLCSDDAQSRRTTSGSAKRSATRRLAVSPPLFSETTRARPTLVAPGARMECAPARGRRALRSGPATFHPPRARPTGRAARRRKS